MSEYPKDLDEAQHEATLGLIAKSVDAATVQKYRQLFQDAEAATTNTPLYLDSNDMSSPKLLSPTGLSSSSGRIKTRGFANLRAHLWTSSPAVDISSTHTSGGVVSASEEDEASGGGGSANSSGSIVGGGTTPTGSGGGGSAGGGGGGIASASASVGSEGEGEPTLYVYNSKTKRLERTVPAGAKSPFTAKIMRNIKPR